MSDAELKRWKGLYDRELERAVKAEQEVMAANMRMVRLERELAVARTCAEDWRAYAEDMGAGPESDLLPWEPGSGTHPYARPEAPRVASRSDVAQGGQRPAELRMVSKDRRAIAKWIRDTSCVWSDDIQDLLSDLAGQIERGEHERWDQAESRVPNETEHQSVSEVWAIYAADGDLCGAAQNKGLAEYEAAEMDGDRPHHAPHTVRRFVPPRECKSDAEVWVNVSPYNPNKGEAYTSKAEAIASKPPDETRETYGPFRVRAMECRSVDLAPHLDAALRDPNHAHDCSLLGRPGIDDDRGQCDCWVSKARDALASAMDCGSVSEGGEG